MWSKALQEKLLVHLAQGIKWYLMALWSLSMRSKMLICFLLYVRQSWLVGVVEVLSHGLSRDWAPGRKAGPAQGSSGACSAMEWLEGWSQDPPLPRPRLRVSSGGKGIVLEIPVYLRPSKGKLLYFFALGCCVWAYPWLAAASDLAVLLSLLPFPSHYNRLVITEATEAGGVPCKQDGTPCLSLLPL